MSNRSFRSLACQELERAVCSGSMSISDFYSRKGEMQQESVTGMDDGHSCTKGLSLLQSLALHSQLPVNNTIDVWFVCCCTGILERLHSFYKDPTSNVARRWLASPTDHYAAAIGDKGWGCGYRNLQMLLSCLARSPLFLQVLFNGKLPVCSDRFTPVFPRLD